MTNEAAIINKLQEFNAAVKGPDVKRTYIEIARMVCIEAMEKLDGAVEQGNFAESQGNYAKNQGNYAKGLGEYAKSQGDRAGEKTNVILESLNSLENGQTLQRVEDKLQQLDMLYSELSTVTTEDIDNMMSDAYTDTNEAAGYFDYVTSADIDAMMAGTYVDNDGELDGITESDIQKILDNAFGKEIR